ncbi:MAG: hypothetical protein P8Z39_07670, partial [Gammaproteobacteria bacterium]
MAINRFSGEGLALLRVLLIEQSATIRHILENVLVKYGYSVETATDFTKGLELIDAETILSNNYDAFLLGWPTTHSAVSEMLLQVLFEDRFAAKPILILAH